MGSLAAAPLWRNRCLILACALALAVAAPAAPPLEPVPFPAGLSEETREIASRLWCPLCGPENKMTVAESPRPFDHGIRLVIEEKVTSGESQQEIIRYFVDRYGERILVSPPQDVLGYALLAAAAAGTAALLWLLTRRRRAT